MEAAREIHSPAIRLTRVLLRLGPMEWSVLLGHLGLQLRLLAAHDPVAARAYQWRLAAFSACVLAVVVAYRRWFEGRYWPRLLRNSVLVAGVMVPYFWLRAMIPIIHPVEFDAQLHAIDLWLVGGDPSVWLERFASPWTTTWFAVAYWGLYLTGGVFIVGMVVFCRRQEVLIEFAFLLLTAAGVASIVYTLVPGVGPYVYLADRFAAPLPGGAVLAFVHQTMQQGPVRDVFPSMHTCMPLCIFLFGMRRMRWVALLGGLLVPQIVTATLFLRYHYLIDLLAGVCLALVLFCLTPPILRGAGRWRARLGLEIEP